MLRVVYFPVKHSCLYNKRQYLIFIFLSFWGSTREEFGRGIPLWARLDFPGGTPYNCLYGEAPSERGASFTRQVYKRVGISLVSSQAIKRVGPRGGASPYKTLLSPPCSITSRCLRNVRAAEMEPNFGQNFRRTCNGMTRFCRKNPICNEESLWGFWNARIVNII